MGAAKKRGSRKGKLDFFPIYRLILFTGFAFVIALADRAPIDLESVYSGVLISQKFLYYWQGVIFRFFPGPYVYRILIPYLLWGLNELTSINLITLDLILKISLLIGVQIALYRYFSAFFKRTEAFLGVLIFNVLLGYLLSFIKGPSIIETIDVLNTLIIAAGLWAIYKNKIPLLCILLAIGLLNRETPLILLPIVFIHEWTHERNWLRVVFVSGFALLIFFAPRILISTWAEATWFNIDELKANLPFFADTSAREAVVANIRLAILLGPFVLIGLHKFKEQPQFLKVAASMAPVLLVVHYFVGRIIETRLWMPIFPLLIPLVINNIFKASRSS